MYATVLNLPVYVLLPTFIIFFNLVCIGLLLIVRKYHLKLSSDSKSGFFHENFSSAINMIFAFTISLVTISAWQSHSAISDSVGKEATALMNIYRTLEAYPPEIRDQGRQLLKDFVNELVVNEWPAMADGQASMKAYKTLLNFANLVQRYKPKDYAELAAQQEELRLLSTYRELRGYRVSNAKLIVDNTLLLVLGLAAMIYLLYQSLYDSERLRPHLVMYTGLTTSIGLVFFLILSINHPFAGSGAVGPEPLEMLLTHFWPISDLM